MNNKFLYSRLLEQKTYLDYYLKYLIPVSNYRIVCFFSSDKEQTGEYEVYDIRKNSPLVKKQMKDVWFMSQPFEYSEREIGFLSSDSMTIWVLDFMESKLSNTSLKLPTQQFCGLILEISDEVKLLYTSQCIKYNYFPTLELLITYEQFNVFQTPDGRCNDNYFSSWELAENRQCGEINIIDKNLLIFFELVKQKYILICKQTYFGDDFQFYLWKPRSTQFKLINVKQSLNATIIKAFDNVNKIVIKEEQPESQIISNYIIITANPNTQQHPFLIRIECDQNLALNNYTCTPYQIDSKGCLLLDTPWIMGNELIVHYYTHTNITVAVCDIYRQLEPYKIINFKQQQKISTFYFSQYPKHFVELYDDLSKVVEEEDIKLPNQTMEVTQYYQHCLLPNQIHFFHFLFQKGVFNQISPEYISELMQIAFSLPTKREKQEEHQ